MFEIRRHGDAWKIYDVEERVYIAHSNNKKRTERIFANLMDGAFEGSFPSFFFYGTHYRINLDFNRGVI